MNAPPPKAEPNRDRPHWPRCGASAAIFRGSEVLLIQRSKGAFEGLWSFPGGHIEPGERARDAAAREVREETCIEAEILGVLDVHDVIMRAADGSLGSHYVLAVYWGRWVAGEPVAASDSRASRFFRTDALSDLAMTDGSRQLVERAALLARHR